MAERTSTTLRNGAGKRRAGIKVKSPFLRENGTRTVPRTSPSLYTRDLFKRSDEAVDRLKHNRLAK